MFRFAKLHIILALTLGMILPAFSPARAQNSPWKSSDFRIDSGGSGEIRTRRTDDELDRAVINLRRNGRADVTVYMGRSQVKLDGNWREDRIDSRGARLNLELRGNYGSFNGDVDGTLALERVVTGLLETWRIRRLDLSGQRGDNRLTLDFEGGRPGNNGGNNDNDRYDGGSGDFQDYSGEARGDGRVREGRDDREINRVDVRLNRGGYAEITLYGDATMRIVGRWRSLDNDRAEIRIDRVNGRTINRGDGQIQFRRRNSRNREVRRLNFDGRISNGELSVEFSADRDSGWDGNENDPDNGGGNVVGIDSDQNGRGTLRTSGEGITRLRRATVNLDRNGRAKILVEATNGTRYTVSGNWTRGRNREFTITVSSALSYNNATGRGKIILRNDREFSTLELSGTFGSRNWNIDFNAD